MHLEDVLRQVASSEAAFADATRNYDGAVVLVCRSESGFPGLALSRELITTLARLGLGLEFDYYDLSSEIP
jgi:hypothetical protein